MDQELAIDTWAGDSRPLAGRRSLATAAPGHGHGGGGRGPLGIVIVVGLARRPPRPAVGSFVALATVGAASAATAHFQHDGVTDLAAVQQHGSGQHAFANIVPSDYPSVQVFGYDGWHDFGHSDGIGGVGGGGGGGGDLTDEVMSSLLLRIACAPARQRSLVYILVFRCYCKKGFATTCACQVICATVIVLDTNNIR